jgi:predicted RecB family nuclease
MASISAIQSMDHRSATKLRKAGVRTTDSLLKLASTRTGRRRLARETSLPEADILGWVNRADLLRIPGVGSEYADLLEVAGVDTIRELRRRNPDRLLETMTELNLRKRLVRRLPTDPMVREWVEEAKQLEPLVTH